MLERISEIQGIGLFHDANGKPYTCQKATLVYADNGRGKSTLATVLRSLSAGDPSLIAHRKTLDGKLSPKVGLQFNNGHKVTFDAGAWSERRAEILVFDAEFVERNIHSGGAVSTNHRKNLLEFALGEAAVAARAAVEKATADAKKAADEVQNLTGQLSGYHVGTTLVQFETIMQVVDADAQIEALQKQIAAAGNTAAILSRPSPNTIAEPMLDLGPIFATLSASLQGVHAQAEKLVKQHVAKLGSSRVEGWLSQGQQIGNSKTCPYCGQDTTTNDLVKAYQAHFNAAYGDLKTKVAALHRSILNATVPDVVERFAQGVATATAQTSAWSDNVQSESITFDAGVSKGPLAELQKLLLDLSGRKQASPADPVGSEEDAAKAIALWRAVVTPMQATNKAIKAEADRIAVFKSKLATTDTLQLQQQISKLQLSKRRFDPVVIDLLGKRKIASAASDAAEKIKKAERDTLDKSMKATLSRYESSINALLAKFGAAFSIKGMDANFRGAAPRSEYGLLLRGKDVSLDGGTPSFATALSEGDKRTLAFAFFVASTLADPKLATRTVVIDDPMCSLDLNRKHHTRAVLKKLYSKAEQLIVLAHDPYFLRDIRETLHRDDPAAPVALFQLILAPGEYTTFAALDVDKECESAYFRHHRLLNDFIAGSPSDPRSVAKAVRPMLEGYLHRRFPGLLPKSLMFGQIVALIRGAASPSPLHHAHNLVPELNEVNEYVGQFHHDTNPGADTIAVVASELKTYVERALAIAHSGKTLV